MKLLSKCCSALLLISLCSVSQASLIRLKMEWSGALYGNMVRAYGFLAFDDQILPGYYPDIFAPPGGKFKNSHVAASSPLITELSLSVIYPSGVKQIFNRDDFSRISFGTPHTYAPAPLDLSKEIVGQNVGMGCLFAMTYWQGSCYSGVRAGTFTLLSKSDAPSEWSQFSIVTSDGYRLWLESLRPTGISEPTSWSLMLVCLVFLVHLNRRRSRSAK
ncbi:hypothetical protein [Neptunomonas sp. XY-337]|uniref:hypothetical protein n=1 Tax=Neptunomonas sp. XY-337 TaxID=2561897 RepID=UPI0010AAFA74|nr:hypothetical protein [Neptunomonas sp. XY-337]